jgi:exonuclease III
MFLHKNICISILLFIFVFSKYVSCDTECPNIISFGDRRTNKNTLRLVQYNVEWLFIDYYSGSNCPGNGCAWHTFDDANKHLSYVAKVVSDLNPDILNLCEVEGCDELNFLQSAMNKTIYNTYLKKGTDTGTGQNVGILTKIDPLVSLYRSDEKISYPIPESTCNYIGSQSSTSVSKHYITEYKINSYNIAFIGSHLIAIPTDPARCAQREAQAQIIQNIVYSYLEKGYEIIVAGDMNDYDGDTLDINSDIPLSSALQIIKGKKGQKKGLYSLENIASKIPQSERYSDWYDSDNNCNTSSQRDYSMIDHVLMTPNLVKKVSNAYIYHGYKEYCGKWDSDHYPVVIDFSFL